MRRTYLSFVPVAAAIAIAAACGSSTHDTGSQPNVKPGPGEAAPAPPRPTATSSASATPVSDAGDLPAHVDGGNDASVAPKGECSTDGDCSPDKVCAFAIADGCTAGGKCLTRPIPTANCSITRVGCGCDGSQNVLGCDGYPDGYAATRIVHTGACGDGGASGGPTTHTFYCGSAKCTAPTQFCKNSQPIGELPTSSCEDVPKGCSGLSACSCVQAVYGGNCNSNNGEITLSIQ